MRAVTVEEHFKDNLDEWNPGWGDIGIEIEMEGEDLKYPKVNESGIPEMPWYAKVDNSMKGPGLEYYLWHPIHRKDVRSVLRQLKDFWKSTGGKPKPTECDAVHVHINCRKLTLDKTMTFIMLLVMLEDFLVRWCGDSREGNLFCLRSRDASGFLWTLRDILIKKSMIGNLSSEHLKYATINIAPLRHFGSVEVRCMQTPKDIMIVDQWVEMLLSIFDSAMKLENIRDVVDVMGFSPAEQFLDQVLGDNAKEFMFPDADQLLFEGRERVKQVIYSAHIYKERKRNKKLIAPPKQPPKFEYVAPVLGMSLGPVLTEPALDSAYIKTIAGTKVKRYGTIIPGLYKYKLTNGKWYSYKGALPKTALVSYFGAELCGVITETQPEVLPVNTPIAPSPMPQAWWLDESSETVDFDTSE